MKEKKRSSYNLVLADIIYTIYGLFKFERMLDGQSFFRKLDYSEDIKFFQEILETGVLDEKSTKDISDAIEVLKKTNPLTASIDENLSQIKHYFTVYESFYAPDNLTPEGLQKHIWMDAALNNGLYKQLNGIAFRLQGSEGSAHFRTVNRDGMEPHRQVISRGFSTNSDLIEILVDFKNFRVALNAFALTSLNRIEELRELAKGRRILDASHHSGINMNVVQRFRIENDLQMKGGFGNLSELSETPFAFVYNFYQWMLEKLPFLIDRTKIQFAEGCPAAHQPSKLGQFTALYTISKFIQESKPELSERVLSQAVFVTQELDIWFKLLKVDVEKYYRDESYRDEIEDSLVGFDLHQYEELYTMIRESAIEKTVVNDLGREAEAHRESFK
jgi:hypothetical protein